MTTYKILINEKTYEKAKNYLGELKAGKTAGYYLNQQLTDRNLSQVIAEEFIELLLRTKKPQIFAESVVSGDGSDWNQEELSILGDISIATPVTVYDNGRHTNPKVHQCPFQGTLLFVPGALLRNGRNHIPADWKEVTKDEQINPESYYQLYERRLLPAFMYANDVMKTQSKMGLITIPGLGCGQFAGRFRGQLGTHLKVALTKFLEKHGAKLSNIKAVYYDPYRECSNERFEIAGINFLVRPLTQGNEGKSQLCHPRDYEEEGDDFSDCELFSVVAWDHVSWPGNDFYLGSRATDDGVKAAATSVMAVMTGIEGQYDTRVNQYNPPSKYRCWEEVISPRGLGAANVKDTVELEVKDNLTIFM